jgi:transposase InsO family protein
LPRELQERVHAEVVLTKRRSGWPAKSTLLALGIAPRSYYRWRQERSWEHAAPPKPAPPYEATAEEKRLVLEYARRHPALRHRELAWRMVDEGVAGLSPSTVYRILKENNLVCPWRRRTKRYRAVWEKAGRPDERWATDLMYVQVQGTTYYLISFLDEYARMIVHWELLPSMDGRSVSVAAQAAIETLPRRAVGRPGVPPEIRTDNGSGYVSSEFRTVLRENGLGHQRIKPHCPEENGLIERAHRTLREELDGERLTTYWEAHDALAKVIHRYNHERLHSALGYLRPIDYYRGNPEALREERKRKLAAARHRRREANLKLRQPTLPYPDPAGVA